MNNRDEIEKMLSQIIEDSEKKRQLKVEKFLYFATHIEPYINTHCFFKSNGIELDGHAILECTDIYMVDPNSDMYVLMKTVMEEIRKPDVLEYFAKYIMG